MKNCSNFISLALLSIQLIALSCSKDFADIKTDSGSSGTLPLRDTLRTVGYLGIITLNELAVNDTDLLWSVIEGEECVTLTDSVIIGRRKGSALLKAASGSLAGHIRVEVTGENYIPVENLLFEVNGRESLSGDTLLLQSCDWVGLLLKGVKPDSASHPAIKSFKALSTHSTGEPDEEGSALFMRSVMGLEEEEIKLLSQIPSPLKLGFRVYPFVNHFIFIDNNPDIHTDDRLIPADSIPSMLLEYEQEIYPEGLRLSEWDLWQLGKYFTRDEISVNRTRHRLYFTDLDNSIEICREQRGSYTGIFIKSGEELELECSLNVPEEFESGLYWADGVFEVHSKSLGEVYSFGNYANNGGKLKISSSGRLSLDSSFSIDGKDTAYIGTVSAILLPDDCKEYSALHLKYEDQNFNKWIEEICGIKNSVKIYWIRD